MTEPETAMEGVIAEYVGAVLAKAPARLAALYAPDVRVFDTWGVWSYEDGEAWAGSIQGWLGSLGEETVQVRFDEVRAARRAESGWLSAFVSYSAVDGAGQVLRSMQNRLSWVLTRIDGRWRIAHEHTSTPISFDTQKAMLHRDI